MNTQLLLASALRTLIMGVSLFAILRILKIRQVRAQRTAWILALVAALAMPLFVSQHIGLRLLPEMPRLSHPHSSTVPVTFLRMPEVAPTAAAPQASTGVTTSANQPPAAIHPRVTTAKIRSAARHWRPSLAATLYVLVAAFLLSRLAIGLAGALRLRHQAARVQLEDFAEADIRVSNRIATPVTIAGSIVLPATYASWSDAKLRIVLSHEQAHVHQRDFSIQLLAALHSAIFWFSPFGWWLQRELSSLGEAMSDLAAVEQAESRASYAEVLLEFATSTQWPLTSVAMARTSNLRVRIERLLSEQLFSQSCKGTRRLSLLATALGIIAICGSTSMVRVHAAQVSTAPAATAAPAVIAKPSAVPAAEPAASNDPAAASSPDAAVAAAPAVRSENQAALAAPQAMPPAEPAQPAEAAEPPPPSGDHGHSSYTDYGNRDSFALLSGDDVLTFNGDWNEMRDLTQARKGLHGDSIFYQHDGQAYILQDPSLIARAKALYAPMEALSREQEALGKQQEALGRQQDLLGRQQESIQVPAPDLQKEVDSLVKAVDAMKNLQASDKIDLESLSNLQSRIGDIQGRLGALQGQAAMERGKLGARQGDLGAQQGKLGAEQGRLGAQQGKISVEAQRQLVPLIRQAIKDGQAKPVN